MLEGSISWDDEDDNNQNDQSGILPDFDTGCLNYICTQLHFCCQTQGKWYRPIKLPTERPFYLLPYGSMNCQRVMGAIGSLEYIIYDTEDTGNLDRFVGHHVFTDKARSLPKIYYCYYEGRLLGLQGEHGETAYPRPGPIGTMQYKHKLFYI